MNISGLFTDFYELTMAQGYFLTGRNRRAVFDMFFRNNPFGGGFTVFAGLDPLLRALPLFRFNPDDLAFLGSQEIFREEFLEYLQNFRFQGDVYAPPEGTIVFPGEPLLRVHADIIEAQLIESLLLNCINYQSLIATKSARIFCASGKGRILEFGMRRAQGPDGALSAARAAYIGGASATSNTAAGRDFGIPVKGTMAHSWVMSFPSELEAFQEYGEIYPGASIFLIDTYDTMGGVENAIKAGEKLKARGKNFGVRLDSGDLFSLSIAVRRKLDDAGFTDATITASNDLDEAQIESLVAKGAPIDFWGVGTKLVTGGGSPALPGVYKLAAYEEGGILNPVMKLSDSEGKSTNPGIKQVHRLYGKDGRPVKDIIALEEENLGTDRQSGEYAALLAKKFERGEICCDLPALVRIREETLKGLQVFKPEIMQLNRQKPYPVVLSDKLQELKTALRYG